MIKDKKLLYKIISVVCLLIAIGSVLYVASNLFGKKYLQSDWVAGDTAYKRIGYEGATYKYKDELVNILCLGIDKEEAMDTRNDEDNSVGQADAIFLVSIDVKQDVIQVLSIPRDTMVDLQMYDGNGNYLGVRNGQLTLQYAYGDGQEFSAQLTSQRVAELLNYIPIHGYVAINLESLLTINDAVGGVDIAMDDDYTLLDPSFTKGSTIHLEGQKLYQYIHGRDITVRGSSYMRINRMKQYIKAFYEKVKVVLAEDVSAILPLFETIEKDMVTSLTGKDIVYLATEALDCTFSDDKMYWLPGEPVRGEIYEEYYPDEIAITEMVLDLFYERLTNQ